MLGAFFGEAASSSNALSHLARHWRMVQAGNRGRSRLEKATGTHSTQNINMLIISWVDFLYSSSRYSRANPGLGITPWYLPSGLSLAPLLQNVALWWSHPKMTYANLIASGSDDTSSYRIFNGCVEATTRLLEFQWNQSTFLSVVPISSSFSSS